VLLKPDNSCVTDNQSETGLHYNWHRSYDPTVGRYTQPDSLGFVDGPSVYGYAGGQPHSFVDPEGEKVSVIGAIGAARVCLRDRAAGAKCAEETRALLCNGVNSAKRIICNAPGCDPGRSARPVTQDDAGLRLRAAEACLALRDAEQAFCPDNPKSLTKHQNETATRLGYANKANKCQAICGRERLYQ
jgi:RHS repeat-associated protein